MDTMDTKSAKNTENTKNEHEHEHEHEQELHARRRCLTVKQASTSPTKRLNLSSPQNCESIA